MKRSEGRILTTHVGSLPNAAPLDRTAGDYEPRLRAQVKEVVARQRALGIDIVNEGEYTKGGNWLGLSRRAVRRVRSAAGRGWRDGHVARP